MQHTRRFGRRWNWIAGVLLSGLVAGCGGGDGGAGGSTGPVSAGTGTLRVSLTDAPACGYDAVNVTVSKVRVHQSSTADDRAAGWVDLSLAVPRKINLLDLNDPTQINGALETLGEIPLAAGRYTQVRLVLEPNSSSAPLSSSLVLSGTTAEVPLATPSAVRSGIKLIHPFDVGAGQHVDLLLDFDACRSVVQTGGGAYKLKPVIAVLPYVVNGIEGVVDPALVASHVAVSAQTDTGEVVRATVPNTLSGKFFLARLPAGVSYHVVVTADNHATKVIAGVPVDPAPGVTRVSTDAAPITLSASMSRAVSGTVTLDPADDEGTVVVAARQVLSGGPVVTVKSVVATVRDTAAPVGDYSYGLTLPIGRPWLGAYSASLPIGFTEQPAVVGGAYTIRGSGQTETTAYATQIPSPLTVSLTLADALNQNFTLRP